MPPYTFQPSADPEDEWIFRVEAGACELCLTYEDRVFKTEEIPPEFPYAAVLMENIIEPHVHPNCRCQLRLIEESLKQEKHGMHKDFNKIQNEFIKYYCKSTSPCEQGTMEFNAWVKDLGLNTSKPYGKSLEAYKWAKDMISKYKEDEKNAYYKVLFAFPIESMNGNVYTEKEIKASVKTVIGKSPSINHWEDTRQEFIEGGVKYVGAEYEDGACEAILQVPKNFICPLCDKGKPLTSWIDEKKIVNVSLEATCMKVGPKGECIGLEFDAPTLLTSDTLPGIPMARIFPLERIFAEALVVQKGGKKMKQKVRVEGLGETLPDGNGQCPPGMIFNSNTGQCEQSTDCPEGQHWSDAEGKCVADEKAPPEGTKVPLGTEAEPDNSTSPIEAMSEDELKKKIADIASQIDAHYDDGIDTTVIEPLQAELSAYKAALDALVASIAAEKKKKKKEQECPDGEHWDPDTGTCVPDVAEKKNKAKNAELQLQVSDLALKKLQAEQNFKSAGEQLAFLQTELQRIIVEKINLEAEVEAGKKNDSRLEAIIDKRDKTLLEKEKEHTESERSYNKQLNEKDKVISQKDTLIEKMSESHKEALKQGEDRLEVTSTARENYKAQLESLRASYEDVDKKYNEQLDTNLNQTKKLTEANETLITLTEEKAELEAKIKKVQRLGKVIVQINSSPEED